VAGLDLRRFQIVAAVTDRVLRLGLNRSELFGACPGGLRLDDPGADLAVAAAVASAGIARPAGAGRAFVGEVALTGSIRPVGGMDQRISAASAAGVTTLVVPSAGPVPERPPGKMRLIRVAHMGEALSHLAEVAEQAPGHGP
jgi:DNA repair protein RadA/Sms